MTIQNLPFRQKIIVKPPTPTFSHYKNNTDARTQKWQTYENSSNHDETNWLISGRYGRSRASTSSLVPIK